MNNKQRKVGVWLIGALGDISTTLIIGTLAIRKELASTTGLITTLPPLTDLPLTSLDDVVFGGIDIRDQRLMDSAESIYRNSRTISRETVDAVLPELEVIDADILRDKKFSWNPHVHEKSNSHLSDVIGKIRRHLQEFSAKHQLDHVVVVNLASAEPVPDNSEANDKLDLFEELIKQDRKDLITPSMACLYAAFSEGCSYINFTPNSGTAIGALQELADKNNCPYYGNDGKTGETLLKTALAPMFAYRNLKVMSWEGVNMLGNRDGKTLSDPDNRVAKIRNKENVLQNILGYPVHSGVNIEYVPSLGDWKTAWDLIHFQGFLDVPMTMQFTWQGCDSILAAPLVLDMVRLSEFAARNNEKGPMKHLACFFKNPHGVSEMGFQTQFEMLLEYAYLHLERSSDKDKLRTLN